MPILTKPGGSWGQQKPPTGTPILEGHPISEGLVGLWAVNEGAAFAFDPITRLVVPGTYSRDSTGRQSIAGSIASTSQGVASLTPHAPFTAIAWATMPPPFSGYPSVFAVQNYVSEGNNQGWAIQNRPDGRGLTFIISSNTSITDYAACNTGSWVAGFHQFAVTTDGIIRRLYVDTVQVASSGNTPLCLPVTTGEVDLGVNTATCYFACVYARALSASEVASLYRDPYQMFAPPAPWRFYSVPATVGGRIHRVLGSGVIGSGIVQGVSRRIL